MRLSLDGLDALDNHDRDDDSIAGRQHWHVRLNPRIIDGDFDQRRALADNDNFFCNGSVDRDDNDNGDCWHDNGCATLDNIVHGIDGSNAAAAANAASLLAANAAAHSENHGCTNNDARDVSTLATSDGAGTAANAVASAADASALASSAYAVAHAVAHSPRHQTAAHCRHHCP